MRIQWRITLLLLSLIITSIFISFYTFPYFISYNAETAQHYLEIIKFADDKWLLDGPLTSHHWLRLSSFPYYIFYPLFATAQFHPLTLPVFWLLTSSLCILLNFYVIRHVSNTKIAIISTILYTFSANILILNRNVGFFNFILPLTYWLI